MRLEHAVPNNVRILVLAVFKQILIGDEEWLKSRCRLEKGETVLSKRNTVSWGRHTGTFITIGNCAGGKKVCRSIKEDVFCFLKDL